MKILNKMIHLNLIIIRLLKRNKMDDLNPLYENTLKILILGDSYVGKSNFIFRYIKKEFNGKHLASIGAEFKSTEVVLGSNKFRLQIWDPDGRKKYESITRSFFQKVQGFIVMFDITNKESYNGAKSWIKSIKDEFGKNPPILLIGNKRDLEDSRVIFLEDIKKYANEENLNYIETSSKTGDNINKSISIICNLILEKNDSSNSFSLNILDHSKKRKKVCC